MHLGNHAAWFEAWSVVQKCSALFLQCIPAPFYVSLPSSPSGNFHFIILTQLNQFVQRASTEKSWEFHGQYKEIWNAVTFVWDIAFLFKTEAIAPIVYRVQFLKDWLDYF